jgi:hypothetical protein
MAKRNRSSKRTVQDVVRARDQTIEAAFKSQWFVLDFYQRDYVWEETQVARLLSDLTRKFGSQWSEEHALSDVRSYDPYFLGPYIYHAERNKVFLVDGQQRVITLLLLLIYLQRRLSAMPRAAGKAAQLHTLIMKDQFGQTVFRVDAEEYTQCFTALLSGNNPHLEGAPDAVHRIWRAYLLIESHFKDTLDGDALRYFAEWLLNRVSLVAMNAGDRDRAEEMYQSINDTGLRLSPMDLIKRFLLTDADEDPRALEGTWTDMVAALERAQQGSAFAYVRTVLRATFPDIARMPGPSLNDATFEWVRVHENDLWPNPKHGDRARLLTETLYPFHEIYRQLLDAQSRLDPRFRAVRYNAFNGIAEQFDLLIAALRPGDERGPWEQKAKTIANFLDLFYVTQTLSDETVGQQDIDDLVSTVLPRVRLSESAEELSRILGEHAVEWTSRLDAIPDLRYDARRKFVHYVLARLTAWIERGATNDEADPTERFLMRRPVGRDFEIEHLFTSTASAYEHKVPDASHYKYLRDRIGALLLLEGGENGKYGGMRLEDKLLHYRKDTRLAGMLNPDFFRRSNGTLEKFLRTKGLFHLVTVYEASTPLAPFIDARGQFYLEIAKHVWSLAELGLTMPSPAPGATAPAGHTTYNVQFKELVTAQLLEAGDRLIGRRRDGLRYARVMADGTIETENGTAASLSRAMQLAVGSVRYPWNFWRVERTGDQLDVVRQRYLERFRP